MIVSYVVHGSPWFPTFVDQSEEIYPRHWWQVKQFRKVLKTSDIHFVMAKIKLELDKTKSELQARSKTSQLWIKVIISR